MEPIQSLSVALGLSALSGVRLYLTVFLTSLSLNQGWLQLSTDHAAIGVLGSDAVMIASGLMLLLEFLADKVPGFDSAWDAIHSFIRPVGATLVSLQVLGNWDPNVKIVAALMMGGVATVTHMTKAGTRLFVNTSPEPFSNVALSTAEDVFAVAMFGLIIQHPMIAGVVGGLMVAVGLWVLPKCWRVARATGWLVTQRLFRPFNRETSLPRHLSADLEKLALKAFGPGREISWAVSALSGKVSRVPGLRSHIFGTLTASPSDSQTLVFLAKKLFRTAPVAIPINGCQVETSSSFLGETLTITGGPEGRSLSFRFPKAESVIVARIADDLRRRAAGAGQSGHGSQLVPENEVALLS